MALPTSTRSRPRDIQDSKMNPRRDDSFSGRNVLTERGRPNSRDRQQQMLHKSDQKSNQPTSQPQKRQLQSAMSPTAKENTVDEDPSPAPPKKRKTPEMDAFTRNSSTSRPSSAPRNLHSTASLSASDTDAVEDIEDLVQHTEESRSQKSQNEAIRRQVNVKNELRKSIVNSKTPQQQERSKSRKRVSTGPRPHKALLYYQERLNGNLEIEPCSGVIKRLRLFNFMCHERFEKEWNSNLNFITGENGSGKSAILSGIIVGLGARANTTSRTKSISELVKTGMEFAKIEITLINHGSLNDEKYGKEITIQRVLDVRGPSTYKICTGLSPKFRPIRRTELDYILFNLGIMVDNPVAVLNQEAARSFLKTKDPGDKYKFFFEGSSLAQFERILQETKSNMDDTAYNLEKTRGVVEDRHRAVTKYEALKHKLEEADRMEEQIELLTIEYRWSVVIADEEKRNEVKASLEKEQLLVSKTDEALQKVLAAKAELLKNSSTSPEIIEVAKTKLRNLGKEEQDIQRESTQLARQANENKGKIRSATTQINIQTNILADVEARLEDAQTRGKNAAEQAKIDYEEKLRTLQQEKEEYEQEYQTLKAERLQFSHGNESLRNKLNDLQTQEKDYRNTMLKMKEEIKNLETKNSKVNRYSAFGRQMEDLMAKIEANRHKFKVVPRGPLGACFTVKNEKWLRLISLILNHQLLDFVVENNADQTLLNQLIRQTFQQGRQSNFGGLNDSINGGSSRRPAVICNKSAFAGAYDISRQKASAPNAPTIFDVIEVENNDTAVLNTLIDSCYIEGILLFESNKAACDILKDRQTPGFPVNCKVGFSLEFYQITPDPRYRLEAKYQLHRNTYLKCSSALQLKHLKKSILEVEESLKALIPELEAKKREEAIIRQEFNAQEEALRSVQRKLADIKTRLLTHSKTITQEPDLSSFVEEINDAKAQLERHTNIKAVAEEEFGNIRFKIESMNKRKEELRVDIEETQSKVRSLTDAIENYQEQAKDIENQIRMIKHRLRDLQGRCDTIKPRLERLEASVEEKTEEAEQLGERVETARSPASIREEVEDYERRVAEAKRIVGDREKILHELSTAKEKYIQLKSEYKCWLEVFRLMQTYSNTNVDYYESMIQIIGNVLVTSFQCLIASRGYKGRLLIDHEKKELYYFVCPDGKASEKTLNVLNCKDNRTIKHYLTEYANGLSGGERSFATICYILSMWQIMECPFFMLDEFDVFMDPLNRKASQNALISHAARFKVHQFFLFTPLDITELQDETTASVVKMFPPLRNNVGANQSQGHDETADSEEESESPNKRRRGGNAAPSSRSQPVPGTSRQGQGSQSRRNRR